MKRLRSRTVEEISGWLFALPALLGFLFFSLSPMLFSAYYSLSDYNILSDPVYKGFENYRSLLSGEDGNFWISVRATLTFALMAVPANIIFAFLIALLLNRNIAFRPFFRSLFYLPSVLPGVATSFVWILLMNPDFGLFNTILDAIGLPESRFFWGRESVIPSIVFMGIWSTGPTQVIFLAGLQEIPRVYYEALEIDGGNVFHKFRYITLPMISPTIFFNLVTGLIGALQVFSPAYIISSGGPNNASLFYVYELWRRAFTYMDMGLASAMAWLMFLAIMLLTAIVFKTANRWVYYEGGTKS